MSFLAEEFIGSHVSVTEANNAVLKGLSGVILDETRESFLVQTEKGRKTVLKHGVTFSVNGREVQGDLILKRPEDRLKL